MNTPDRPSQAPQFSKPTWDTGGWTQNKSIAHLQHWLNRVGVEQKKTFESQLTITHRTIENIARNNAIESCNNNEYCVEERTQELVKNYTKRYHRFIFTYLHRVYHNKHRRPSGKSTSAFTTLATSQKAKAISSVIFHDPHFLPHIKQLTSHEMIDLIISAYNRQPIPTQPDEFNAIADALDYIHKIVEKHGKVISIKNISSILSGQGLPKTEKDLAVFKRAIEVLAETAQQHGIEFKSISSILSGQGLPRTEEDLTVFTEAIEMLVETARQHNIEFKNISSILHRQGLPKTEEDLAVFTEAIEILAETARQHGIEFKNISSILIGQGLPKTKEDLKVFTRAINTLVSIMQTLHAHHIKESILSNKYSQCGLSDKTIKEMRSYVDAIIHSVTKLCNGTEYSEELAAQALNSLSMTGMVTLPLDDDTIRRIRSIIENDLFEIVGAYATIHHENHREHPLDIATNAMKDFLHDPAVTATDIFIAMRMIRRNIRSLRRVVSGEFVTDHATSPTQKGFDTETNDSDTRTLHNFYGAEDSEFKTTDFELSLKSIAKSLFDSGTIDGKTAHVMIDIANGTLDEEEIRALVKKNPKILPFLLEAFSD